MDISPKQSSSSEVRMNGTINSTNSTTFSSSTASATPPSATALMDEHDAKLHTFLYLLSEESSSSSLRNSANITNKNKQAVGGRTTVPEQLTRRILNRQGVNFIDETVGSIVSIAADKFLATVLSQSIACRDHRLEGEEVRNQHQRFQQKYQRKRKRKDIQIARKKQAKEALQQAKLTLVQANQALSQVSTSSNINTAAIHNLLPNATSTPTNLMMKPKNKKEIIASLQQALATAHSNLTNIEKSTAKLTTESKTNKPQQQNGNILVQPTLYPSTSSDDEDEDDDDWIEENEEEDKEQSDEEDDDDERYVLQLCDVVRPLESWGIHLNGRVGLVSSILDNNPNSSTTASEQQQTKDDTTETKQQQQQQHENKEERQQQQQVVTILKQHDHTGEKKQQQQQQQENKKAVAETSKSTVVTKSTATSS